MFGFGEHSGAKPNPLRVGAAVTDRPPPQNRT